MHEQTFPEPQSNAKNPSRRPSNRRPSNGEAAAASDPQPQVGDVIDLDVTGVAHQGVFVARHAGRVVFVPDAIPGERVRARLTEAKPRFARAVALEILEASPDRRSQVLPEGDISREPEVRAGSADFGHIALPRQRELKSIVLRDAFERIGHFDADAVAGWNLEVAPVGDAASRDAVDLPGLEPDHRPGRRWRTRELLHVDAEGRVGPYAARTHTVVPVASLPLAVDELEELGVHRGLRKGHKTVQLVIDERKHFDGPGRTRIVLDGGHGATVVRRVHGVEFQVDEGGFWQVHRDAPTTLVDTVASLVAVDQIDADAPHLDLYGGVGLFAVWLARAGLAVTTVEADQRASELAEINAREFERVDVRGESVEDFLRREAEQAPASMYRRSLVVLDPPRSGAGKKVVADLAKLQPAQVIYVACDPVALARDARLLADAGYQLADVRAFDLFPHSHHFETVVSFVR
ncbi:class I SAM-dependent RNA methyltransferase [Pseudoclavibacter sp. 13-3]|uniref:class I SAM-dependent RNA methyltransferase n=1 Tax=Pseudoclavibacter sp. 13-3 TaxID=2901228 RepID=UPI001E37399E|nr:TRAM domain-containing protein [Pseudoclavibacter sp. 13-3]